MPRFAKNYHTSDTKTPTQLLRDELEDFAPLNPDFTAFQDKLRQVHSDIYGIQIGRRHTPADIKDLFYVSQPIRRIQQLDDNWDGKGSEKIPPDVVELADQIWELLLDIMPAPLLPDVLPGGSGFIAFSCRRIPGKNLQIGVFREDDSVVCDWLLETRANGRESGDISETHELSELVARYLAA